MRKSTVRKLVTSGIAATLLAGATGVALAADRGEQRFDRLARLLELNEEQQTEMKNLWSERREAMKERHEERKAGEDKPMGLRSLDPTADTFEADVEKLIADAQARVAERIHDQAEMKKQISEILSPEQFDKWQTLMDERGGPGERGDRGFGKGPGRGDKDCR